MKASIKTNLFAFALTMGTAVSAMANVCFFSDINFQGRSFCLSAGQEVARLGEIGFNDRISSIRVTNGALTDICTDIDFQGECVRVERNVYRMGEVGLNDQISSVYVFRR